MKPICSGIASRTLLLCLILAALSACHNPRKLYQRGNYDDALSGVIHNLQRRPDDSRSRELLPQVYRQDLSWHQSQIDQALASQAPGRWLQVHQQYLVLQQQYRLLQQCPAALELVQPKDVSVELQESARNAAQGLYQQGQQILEQPGPLAARQAYALFSQALDLDPGLSEANQALQEAYNRALVHLELAPVALQGTRLQDEATPLMDAIHQVLGHPDISPFVSWVDPQTAGADSLVDQELMLRFHDFEWGNVQRDTREMDRIRDSVVLGQTTDAQGHSEPVYGTVKARVRATRISVSGHGLLDYQIRQRSDGQVLASGQIPAAYDWVNEYGSFQGDRRALNRDDLRMIGGHPVTPPTEREQVLVCNQPALQRLRQYLVSFYR